MSNTLGTTNATVIAQEALEKLVALLPILGQIATDHSKEKARFGEAVVVHEVAAAEAIDWSKAGGGYVPSDRSQIDIPVTINKHKHHTYGVNVQEASSSRVDLIQRFAMNAAYSLGAAITNDLFALITAANFPHKTVKALGNGGDAFDRKQLVLVGNALDKRHVQPFGRFAVLNSDYHSSLLMDNNLLTIMLAGGADAAKSGMLKDVSGFALSKYTSMSDNDEFLVGIAGTRTALALATRVPDDPGEGQSNCNITTVTEKQTGLSIQVREWYEPTPGEYRRSYTLMYGVAKGQTDCLQRIVSKEVAG